MYRLKFNKSVDDQYVNMCGYNRMTALFTYAFSSSFMYSELAMRAFPEFEYVLAPGKRDETPCIALRALGKNRFHHFYRLHLDYIFLIR